MARIVLILSRFITLVFILITLSSCTPYQKPLTVGAAPWPGFEFLFLSKELGYLHHSQFSLFELPSSTSVIQAFQTGKLDVAFLSLDEVLTLAALGIDLKVISVIDQSTGGDALLVKPEIKTLQDLKWHSIGYENKAAGALLLSEFFKISKLNNQTVQLFEVKQNEVKESYLKGDIDALIVREPEKQQLLALGAKELLNSSQLELPITHLLIARKDIFNDKEEQISQLLKRFYQAHDYYLKNKKDALTTMSVRLQLYPYLLEKSFSGSSFIPAREALMALSGAPSNIERQANQLAIFMKQKNMLGKVPANFNALISTRILERVIYE